jgi:menaquinone-9 beta-reductase
MTTADLVVVGGGPAGLATAIAARRHGLAVTLLERRRPPLDKACGEGLLPAGVAALARLGVEPPARRFPFRGIRYRTPGGGAAADFPDGARGLGIRRTELSAALLARAETLGVDLRFGVRAESVAGGRVHSSAGEFTGRFVVGADGLHSALRRDAGLERPTSAQPRFGVTRHFRGAPWSDHVEVLFGDRAEAYVTPLAEDEIGVAILWSGGKGGFDALLATRFPSGLDLAAKLARLTPLGRDLGAGPFRQRVRRRTKSALALAGDAGGYVDALTGEGLSLAFEQAEALAEALRADPVAAGGGASGNALERYERDARRLAALPDRLTRLSLFAALHPAVGRRYVAALARDPALFSLLLGALGSRRPLGAGAVLRLAGRLVTPGAVPAAAATSP